MQTKILQGIKSISNLLYQNLSLVVASLGHQSTRSHVEWFGCFHSEVDAYLNPTQASLYSRSVLGDSFGRHQRGHQKRAVFGVDFV